MTEWGMLSDDAISADHCLQYTSPNWMNLRNWIAWKIGDHRQTDRPLTRPPIVDGRAGVLDGEVDWSTALGKGDFGGFQKLW